MFLSLRVLKQESFYFVCRMISGLGRSGSVCQGRVLVYCSKCISGSNTLRLNIVAMPYVVYFVASVLTMLLLADFMMENITHWVILIADNDTFQHSPLFAVPYIWSLAWSFFCICLSSSVYSSSVFSACSTLVLPHCFSSVVFRLGCLLLSSCCDYV